MTDQTPSPQSVVVPGSAWERFLYRSDFLRGAAVVDGHDVSLRSFASLVEELKAAAAPAPSSLAGGEVELVRGHIRSALRGLVGVDETADRILAALSPEAPASEGEAVVFRDVFLSWHEECGTVERAGYGASPIGKFQNRWPGFHKKLWDAAMTSHDALRDAWVKVAKECEK